jgi:L-arabinose isomerase
VAPGAGLPDARTELLVIDETTTAREFENRIRANAAYYRLARGL